MRSLSELDAYAAEIRVPIQGGWRKGSGYVIGPCRILTALHVLVGEEDVLGGRTVAAPDRIEVRAYGDFAERFGEPDIVLERYLERVRVTAQDGDFLWRPATLRWPRNGTAMPRYDVAILDVRPEAALRYIRSAPRIPCIRPTADFPCRATGFPEWTAETSGGVDVSSPKPVTGQLTLSAPTALGLRSFNATNGAPPNSEEWKRFSGAAFLNQHSGVLVGIASAIMRAAGNDLLWLTQVADLAEGLEFQDFWTEAGMPRPSRFHASGNAPPRLLIDPLAYLHQFDRTRPADRIVDVLDPPMDEQPNGNVEAAPATAALDEAKVPPVFLIAGRWMDLPDEMVKRIRDQILPELLGNRHGDAVWLKWRYAGDGYSPDQIVAKLREEVAVSLAAPRPRHIASLAPLGESARHRDWNLVIGVDKANEQDAQALCQFLGEFAKLGGRQGPPSLYVNVVSDTSLAVMQDPRIKSFTRLVKEGSASLTGRIVLVDEIYLHDCAFEDIALWSKDLENYCRTTAEQCRTYLERALPNGTYPLRDVKESLSGLVPAR